MSESSLPSRTDFWSKEEEEKELLHFINQAEDVDSLKKIGLNNKQAENVLKFKAYHGPLKSLDELLKISGIGERTVAKVKLLGAPKPQGKISVQAQEHPRKPSKVMNSNKEREKRERLLSALILGGVVFSISYFGLLAIANNGRAWFIASCIVSSLVLLFVLLGVLGTWFAKADPDRIKNLFVAVPFFISMLFGVVLALTKAPGQFPPSPSSASSSSVARVKSVTQHEPLGLRAVPRFSCSAMRAYFDPWKWWLGGTVINVECKQLGENAWQVIGRVRFDKFQPSESWVQKFIDRLVLISEKIFQSEYRQFVQSVRLEAEALYVTVYGDHEWRLVLAATFPKTEALKIKDWETFKNQSVLNPFMFFDLMENVFFDI